MSAQPLTSSWAAYARRSENRFHVSENHIKYLSKLVKSSELILKKNLGFIFYLFIFLYFLVFYAKPCRNNTTAILCIYTCTHVQEAGWKCLDCSMDLWVQLAYTEVPLQ